MALNINTSIIDFAKSKNIDSSFEGRKRLYERIGLNKDLGDYRGSVQQNVQFLKTLQSRPDLLAQSPALSVDPTQEVINGLPKTQDQLQQEAQAGVAVPQQFKNLIAPEQPLTPEEILARVQNRPMVELERQGAEQAKNVLQAEIAGKKTDLENRLASRGLYFSGRRGTGLQSLDADQVAKAFNIDLNLAKTVTRAIEDEQAQEQKREIANRNTALKFLEQQGLTVSPDGTLVPTLEAKRFEETQRKTAASEELAIQREDRALRGEVRAETQLQQSEQRLQIAERAEKRLADQLSKTSKLTSTQIRSGATNARMSVEDFSKLGEYEQNKYTFGGVKNFTDEQLREAIRIEIADGVPSQRIREKITANEKIGNKERAQILLDELVPKGSKGFVGRTWDYVSNFFE